jgi:hypothetical protein
VSEFATVCLSRAWIKNGGGIAAVIAQGLKPFVIQALFGTTEIVP